MVNSLKFNTKRLRYLHQLSCNYKSKKPKELLLIFRRLTEFDACSNYIISTKIHWWYHRQKGRWNWLCAHIIQWTSLKHWTLHWIFSKCRLNDDCISISLALKASPKKDNQFCQFLRLRQNFMLVSTITSLRRFNAQIASFQVNFFRSQVSTKFSLKFI